MKSKEAWWRSQLTLSCLGFAFGVLVAAPVVVLAQGPGIEDGQWSYIGGDAWHTRYTEADEIDASNFENLEIVWQWNGGVSAPAHHGRHLPMSTAS
ncbi:MAG: hypothetical protein CM1200mP36_00680 [Gammaproteobacteria bacterium]|nr:MAG: hypothetical protein CM1200mP36_00680 [Gammaproteobacteria bacterium]